MSKSWGHTLRPYTDEEIAANPSWWHCSWPRCKAPATHESHYEYVTGRAGRWSYAQRQYCDEHAARFAEKHGLLSGARNSQGASHD